MAEFPPEKTSIQTNPRLYANIEKPRYAKPTQIGTFCKDKNGDFLDDSSRLKYYYKQAESDVKKRAFDLDLGCDEFIAAENESESYWLSLDNLLKWIVNHRAQIVREGAVGCLWPDFVCWRGLLTKLLTTVYEQRDDWIIVVSLFRGTYYLCEYETEKRHHERLHPEPRQARMTYWGRKFEQYCVSESPGLEPESPRLPISANEQFCSIVTSKLDQHRLLFGGEVDCCDPAYPSRYIELKTNRIFSNARQEQNFHRFKTMKWWAQSFLLGVGEIVAGFRDDEGSVKYLKSYDTRELPRTANGAWDPGTSFAFTHRLLNFVKEAVRVDDPRATCVLRYDANVSVVSAEFHPGPSQWTFLPDWYIQAV